MPTNREVLLAMCHYGSAMLVQEQLGIKPSRLRRILNSPRFQRQLELERQYAEFRARRLAREYLLEAAYAMARSLRGSNEREVRKGASELLRLATQPELPQRGLPGPTVNLAQNVQAVMTELSNRPALPPKSDENATKAAELVRTGPAYYKDLTKLIRALAGVSAPMRSEDPPPGRVSATLPTPEPAEAGKDAQAGEDAAEMANAEAGEDIKG